MDLVGVSAGRLRHAAEPEICVGLDGSQPAGYAVQTRSHNAVAAAVAQGRADWGLAIEWVARLNNLGFLPLEDEQYDFVIPVDRLERPAVVAFRRLLEQPEVRAELTRMGFGPKDK